MGSNENWTATEARNFLSAEPRHFEVLILVISSLGLDNLHLRDSVPRCGFGLQGMGRPHFFGVQGDGDLLLEINFFEIVSFPFKRATADGASIKPTKTRVKADTRRTHGRHMADA